MKNDFELFKGKTMSSLFQDIYTNQNTKKKKISDLINEVKVLIKVSNDMMYIGPILSGLLETSVKNDEQLIKLAQIAQKVMNAENKNDGDDGFLTVAEKAQLLKDLKDTIVSDDAIADDIQDDIDTLKKLIK